jgi:hypothetical protein
MPPTPCGTRRAFPLRCGQAKYTVHDVQWVGDMRRRRRLATFSVFFFRIRWFAFSVFSASAALSSPPRHFLGDAEFLFSFPCSCLARNEGRGVR